MSYLANPVRVTLVPALAVAAGGAWFAGERFGPPYAALGWLVGVSLATYVTWWIDKRQAQRQGYRVPEWTLHALSALGGGAVAVLAMQSLRHKTRKRVFRFGHPVLAALSLAALGAVALRL